jgi:Predicted ABC-type sugar transport system, permease component
MNTKKIDWAQILKKYGIVVILCLMVIAISIAKPNFLSSANLFNVLTQSSIFGILALGVTLVIIAKGIDLSLGSVLALSGGIGTIWGAVIGALILGVLRNGLTLLGVHPYWQQVAEGIIIVVAVIIDMRTNAQKR